MTDPHALAFDSSGNLFVTNEHWYTVSQFAPGSTTPTGTFTGLSGPTALAFDSNGYLYVANDIGTVSELRRAGAPTAGGVSIESSSSTRPMSLGGANSAVAGINLTDAELAQIQTTATGMLTLGGGGQTGDITFTTATPATTPGASTEVAQYPGIAGQIILDDAGPARASTATAEWLPWCRAPAASWPRSRRRVCRWPPRASMRRA